MASHSNASLGARHPTHNFEFADAATRIAAGVVAADIGKVAKQVDDNSFWILRSVGPSVWTDITSAGSGIANVVEDATPQLGGTLDCNAQDISNSVNITFAAEIDNGTTAAPTTIDWNAGQKQRVTLGIANTVLTLTAPPGPCNLILKIIQDGTGGRTVTWPGSVLWPGGTAPSLSASAAAVDVVAFYYDGTNYHAVASLNFS